MKRHPMYRRRKANKHTVVRAGVGVIVRDGLGRVLLEQRSDSGCWGIPGGSVEPGESVAQTAVREMKEETGLTVKVTGLFGVYSSGSRLVTYPERVVQLVDSIVEAKVLRGRLKLSPESLAMDYFLLDDLPPQVVPAALEILKDLRRGRQRVLR